MTTYRKKPVIIEAFQMTTERRWDNSEWPTWLHQAWNKDPDMPGALYCKNGGAELFLHTFEGEHAVTPGDYIIQGISGELYPCKPDIFEATYEPVTIEEGTPYA